jgi:hypothetical protein
VGLGVTPPNGPQPDFIWPQVTTDGGERRSDLAQVGPVDRPRQTKCCRALPSQILPIMVSKPAVGMRRQRGSGTLGGGIMGASSALAADGDDERYTVVVLVDFTSARSAAIHADR